VARKKVSANGNGEVEELRDLVEKNDDVANGSTPAKPSRRGLLKIAGAALAGAAGTMALRAVPAAAATGNPVLAGCVNSSNDDQTTFLLMGSTAPNPPLSFFGSALKVQAGMGVKGAGYFVTDHSQEIGLFGQSKGSDNSGNLGTSTGTGVLGASVAGIGVEGDSVSGTGGHFMSSTGYDASLGQAIPGTIGDTEFHGSGRLAMVGRTDVGGVAPNIAPFFVVHTSLFAGAHFQHELIRGNDGSIWASTYAQGGTNRSRWRRINTLRVDTADGLGAAYKPFRRLDTRSGARKAAGSTTVVACAGTGTAASAIPADAIGVVGNLTATSYTGGGFLTIAPAGVTVNTSALNFQIGQASIANSFICGLSGGSLQIKVAGHSTHILLDITGYFQ
jgi:hypothetical protein